MAVLPEKLEKLYKLAEMLIVPAAVRAAGPALMSFKAEGDSASPAGPSKTDLFNKMFADMLFKAFEALAEPRKKESTGPVAKKLTGKAALEERISKYSLMSKEELEAQLAAEKQGRTLFNDNLFSLSCLSIRMEKVISRPFLLANNPVHPQTLSAFFRDCCEKATDNRTTSNAAINSWGKTMEKSYAEWLDELNNTLIKQRILPDLDEDDVNNRYKHSQEAERNRARAMRQNLISEVTGKPAEGADAAKPEEMLEGIAKLVKDAGLHKPEMQAHIVSNKTGPAIDTSEVLSALRNVSQTVQTAQVNTETGYREKVSEQTLADLIKASTNLSSFALNDQTQSSIALLSMMFSKLSQEENIANPIKPLLDDLQMPMLKKALQDDTFFADADNSAQQLVNEIAKVGAHWTPKQNASRDPMYKKLVSIVEEVKEKHEDNEDIFEENLQTLNEFVEREERRSSLLEERIIEAEQAQARAEVARQRVKSAISIRCYNKIIPPVTLRFLEQQWESVLFFHINKDEGDQSDELRQALADLDQLIDAANGKAVDLRALFTSMNKQMTDIGLERGDREQLLKELLQELKTQQVKAAEAAAAPPAPVDAPTGVAVAGSADQPADEAAPSSGTTVSATETQTPYHQPEPEPEVDTEDQYTEIANSIRVNSWFHFKPDDSSDKQKIKLAAIIKHNGTYIFVNREGIKVLVTKKPGVAQHFREGKLITIEDAVFFDRALESVISSLRA